MRMIKGYYFITDASLTEHGNNSDVRDALKAGVTVVQYRNKSGTSLDMYKEAKGLAKLCKGKALFIVNDRIDIALAVNADGVHIGRDDVPYKEARRILGSKKIVGVSAGDLKEARIAYKNGADYIGVGPVFFTSTKHDAGTPCGVRLIRKIKTECNIPLVAIGGISLKNAQEVISAGADAVSAISAVITKSDVTQEINAFQKLFDRAC